MKPSIETHLHYYYFNTANEEEKKQYKELFTKLRSMGLELFDCISGMTSQKHQEWRLMIKSLDGKIIPLETDYLFGNQWNTAPMHGMDQGLRIFDWTEEIYPNRKIKEGYWLDQTEEMKQVRNDTYVCGYCGARYLKPESEFCVKCLGSEYLEEKNLPLLELVQVSKRDKHSYKKQVPANILDLYNSRQRIERKKRMEKRKEEEKQRLQDEYKNAEIEFKGKSMLIDADFDFDNCIYYSHTQTFCIGWRKRVSEEIAQCLDEKLKEIKFPYKYEILKE